MKKYDVWFCKCGHIHLMDEKWFDWMSKDCQNRHVIRICQNCGATYEMWLSESFYGGYDVNGKKVENFEVWGDANVRILFNEGIAVPLVNGRYADYYCNGTWWCDNNSFKVDTAYFIKEVQSEYKYEADDILTSISGYVVGIDWTNTPYAK